MTRFSERFMIALSMRDMTQSDLSRLTGIGKSAISQYLKGSFVPKQQRVHAIAKALRVSEAWLMGADVPMERNDNLKSIEYYSYHPTHRIPVLGRISAGLPLYADEHIEKYIYTELNGGSEYFGLRVVGDSMTAARICDGDIIIVRQQATVEDGEIAVVMVNSDDATVKRFHRSGRTVTLSPQSYNPAHQPQIYDLTETSIRIIGKVVQVIYQLEN